MILKKAQKNRGPEMGFRGPEKFLRGPERMLGGPEIYRDPGPQILYFNHWASQPSEDQWALIHCSQRFSWPIYSQSTSLFQRLKQVVNVCLEAQQFYSQISLKNQASRKIIK